MIINSSIIPLYQPLDITESLTYPVSLHLQNRLAHVIVQDIHVWYRMNPSDSHGPS